MLIESKSELQTTTDPWTLYQYAMRSPATKEKYLMRLGKFLRFLNLQGRLEDKARFFAGKGKCALHNNGVDSIIDFNNAGIPYIRGQKHLDLHSVFGKPMVQTTIFKNSYRTLKLDEVSKAVLGEGIDSGKYKGLTGSDFQILPVEDQKKYVLKDAELVIQLSKHNNSEVLDAMKAISELTG